MYWGQLYFTSTILSKGHKGANNFLKVQSQRYLLWEGLGWDVGITVTMKGSRQIGLLEKYLVPEN